MLKLATVLVVLVAVGRCEERPGHLQPLGSHRPPEGDVETIDHVPSPVEFYEKYVAPGKPVLMKGATLGSRAFRLWDDAYLTEKFGKLIVMTEHGKKENRSDDISYIQLKTFLSRYNETDEYLVETLPAPMRDDFQLLRSLLCGGFTKYLRDAVMWFSSGGTKSVLHYDNVENVNCLMSGQKDLFLADKAHEKLAHMDANGAHSSVDVDAVDMDKYPGLGQIPWWRAHMEAGDCFYIPFRWFHQIRSFNRNMAINIWWIPVPEFDKADCYVDRDLNGELKNLEDYSSLSNFEFSPGEAVRIEFLQAIVESKTKKLTKLHILDTAVGSLEEVEGDERKRLIKHQRAAVDKLFEMFDVDKDDQLNRAEVLSIPPAVIIKTFGEDKSDSPPADPQVMDTYARDHEGVLRDDLDEIEMKLPDGFEFPEDYDPDTYDMDTFLKASQEASEADGSGEEDDDAARDEL